MTQEEYRSAAADVVYLAACMVNGIEPEAERVAGMNLEQLYQAASRHMLTGIVAYALEAAGVRDKAFEQAKGKAIRKEILFDTERTAILAQLEREGIWYLPLKGTILKSYYPRIGMRQMSDNDILFDATRAEDVRTLMEGRGYRAEHFGRGVHDCYFKEPVLNFEFHRELFGPYHGEMFRPYYEGIRQRLLPDEGKRYGYHLSPEDFYIYVLAHEYKHYARSGTGLRSLLDSYLYLGSEELDEEYVAREVEQLGIAGFEAANRSLAQHLFGAQPLTQADQEMLDYILASGTYGRLKNRISNEVAEKGRWGYYLARAFPPFKVMSRIYPVLKKLPLLYPLCDAHRLVHAFIFKHERFVNSVKWGLPGREGHRKPDDPAAG